jgi:TrmH family RNA methyltransferase
MLVDGYEELALALASGARPVSLYWCDAFIREEAQRSLIDVARAAGAEVCQVSRVVFERISYREAPDGWLAVFPALPSGLDHLRLREGPLILVAESVEKPGNLGAILRTADAAGVDAVISAPSLADWGNPNVVRASRGAVFTVPVAEAGREELAGWLRDREIRIVATTPDADLPFTAADLSGGVAVVVGSEKHGLSSAWLREAHVKVRIPMSGRVNSLNVATSAALVIYEAVRQRAGRSSPGPALSSIDRPDRPT